MLLGIYAIIIASGETFSCTPTHVWDGDGPIWCSEGPKVRLAGIAAREIDETCRRGHPCPDASGTSARDYLASILGDRVGVGSHGHILVEGVTLKCLSRGNARGGRTAAWCSTPAGTDLSCAMVQGGYALKWARYEGDDVCKN